MGDSATFSQLTDNAIYRIQGVVNDHTIRVLKIKQHLPSLPGVYRVSQLHHVIGKLFRRQIRFDAFSSQHQLVKRDFADLNPFDFKINQGALIRNGENCIRFAYQIIIDKP